MIARRTRPFLSALATLVLIATPAAAAVTSARVERTAPEAVSVTWDDANPVDVYLVSRPDFDRVSPDIASARLLVKGSRTGRFDLDHADPVRLAFVLVDASDRSRFPVAERLVPLAQGSNFRDIGGYVGAGGKHVRWGLIYRSAGQPLLTPSDVAQIQSLGVTQLVDLRSSEERVIAPSRITGIPYTAVGYSMMDMMKSSGGGASSMRNGVDIYRNFPHFLAPQLKVIFAHLLGNRGPIVYNCSAGQDRTGFTTAIILSALGVSRATIIEDYHLSTTYRRPEYEMAVLDPASKDPVTRLFAAYQQRPNWKTADPLKTADGTPYLAGAFQEIDQTWGSVDAYLIKEIGLTPADLLKLRLLYLE